MARAMQQISVALNERFLLAYTWDHESGQWHLAMYAYGCASLATDLCDAYTKEAVTLISGIEAIETAFSDWVQLQ